MQKTAINIHLKRDCCPGTGSGMMGTETAALADYPWHSFRDSITEVVVGDGITAVGKNAFSTCPNLSGLPSAGM